MKEVSKVAGEPVINVRKIKKRGEVVRPAEVDEY